jgi:two-component system cell cycle sensor histidine kinase/response regulator CckA
VPAAAGWRGQEPAPRADAGCAIDALLEHLRSSLRHLCGPSLALRIEPAAGRVRVAADPLLLERVLLNLVANARDAAGPGGQVIVRSAHRRSEPPGGSDSAVIEVADDGPPIPPEVFARMGEAFFTTKPAGQGTGLGLATVRELLAGVGGVLIMSSAAGRGACAAVHLPALAPPGESGVVLLVEDDPALRRLAERALARRGWDVVAAASAEAALLEPPAGGLAALVTDVSLPGLDGAALAAEMRRIAGRPDLPVVLVSGLAAPPPDAPPGVAFLAKPYDLGALADLLADLTGAARQTESSFVPPKTCFMNK